MIGLTTVVGAILSTPAGRKAALIGGGLVVAIPLSLIGGIAGTASMDEALNAQCGQGTLSDAAAVVAGSRPSWWNQDGKGADRDKNVGIIVGIVRARGLPDRAAIIALATALQESRLISLPGGDRDSAGLFQQRPTQGWGTLAQVTDPVYATNKFLDALQKVLGWPLMTVTEAAQKVQKSAFADAYAQHEALATQLVIAAGRPATPASPPPAQPGNGAPVAVAAATACPDVQPASAAGSPVISGRWANPLKPAKYGIGSVFGAYRPNLPTAKLHKGQDLTAPIGTPIYAVCDAVVAQAGPVTGGGGNQTTLDCGGGITIKLMHQSAISTEAGASVTAGQPIGAVGSTGNSTGPHLHEQVEVAGVPINPVPFMAQHGVPL
ncbi:MAG: M23 family metallopeptidase [Intrasporangium sp.]|uniref:M23 family metallopeptidase n=1 Tax=Intrasporangium sp. TaxID=1925024 RepID=UPI002649063B|nr:M23 family metallopeptidase [Intrasporangium sp.]MDN5798122.1 M23 family metallopeptidase [Intrasporangium sp.]